MTLETDPLRLVGRAQEVAVSLLPSGVAFYCEPEGSRWSLRSRRGQVADAALELVVEAGLPVGRTPTLDVPWSSGEAEYHDTYDPDTDRLHEALGRIGSTGVVPVRVAGVPRGLFGLALFGGPHRWSTVERGTIATIVRSLGLALGRAQSLAEREAQSRSLAAFAGFTEALGVQADMHVLAALAVEVVERALEAESVTYYELEGGLWRARVSNAGADPATRHQVEAGLLDENPMFAAAQLGPVFSDGPASTGSLTESTGGEAISEHAATAILPVALSSALRGLFVVRLRVGRRWSEPDRAVVRAVARGLALSLERAELARLEAQTRALAEQNTLLEQQTVELEAQKLELKEQAAALAAANEELRRKTATLEEHAEEAETFIYTVSHDLRTPLLSLQAMSDILGQAVRTGDAGEAEFVLGRIHINVQRMGALLDDLLSLSRVGRSTDEPEPLDLGAAVAAAALELEPRLASRGFALELPPAWPMVRLPSSELGQVLTNLLSNACKWAGRAGEPPMATVSWSLQDERIALRVSDNGPGVPERHRELVFGLFQKLDPRSEGTGVGLAIVRRIANRHGGRAWVEQSELGGADFVVTLPAA